MSEHCLVQVHLTVNLGKWEFAKARQIGQGKVRPLMAKAHAIKQFPQPLTKKADEFPRVGGLLRGFCGNCSMVVAPLTVLLKANVKSAWSSAWSS